MKDKIRSAFISTALGLLIAFVVAGLFLGRPLYKFYTGIAALSSHENGPGMAVGSGMVPVSITEFVAESDAIIIGTVVSVSNAGDMGFDGAGNVLLLASQTPRIETTQTRFPILRTTVHVEEILMSDGGPLSVGSTIDILEPGLIPTWPEEYYCGGHVPKRSETGQQYLFSLGAEYNLPVEERLPTFDYNMAWGTKGRLDLTGSIVLMTVCPPVEIPFADSNPTEFMAELMAEIN